MLGNLSLVLLGLAAIVAVITYVGAHSSPLNVPNISKAGSLVAVSLLIVGLFAGFLPSKVKYDQCEEVCLDAMNDLDGEHGDADKYVSPARVGFKACLKGEEELSANNEKAKVQAETLLALADELESSGGSSEELAELMAQEKELGEKVSDPVVNRQPKVLKTLTSRLNAVKAQLDKKDPVRLREHANFLLGDIENKVVRDEDQLNADCRDQSVKTCAMTCFEPPEDCAEEGDEDGDGDADCDDQDCASMPQCKELTASSGA